MVIKKRYQLKEERDKISQNKLKLDKPKSVKTIKKANKLIKMMTIANKIEQNKNKTTFHWIKQSEINLWWKN